MARWSSMAHTTVNKWSKKVCQGHMAITWPFLACSGSILGQSKGQRVPKGKGVVCKLKKLAKRGHSAAVFLSEKSLPLGGVFCV